MKVSIICFTRQGSCLCAKLCAGLGAEGVEASGYVPERFLTKEMEEQGIQKRPASSVSWAGERFREREAMVFIGAAGIALRCTAPWIRDKMEDPPVLVMDEKGAYVIPVLSGHLGGANALALRIARITGAQPVITTATDVNGLFAPDVFAAGNGLSILGRSQAKAVASDLLEGKPLGFIRDYPGAEEESWIPQGFQRESAQRNLWVTIYERQRAAGDLVLVPPCVILGVGCRRGVSQEQLQEQIQAFLQQHQILPQAVTALATIDLKAHEPGLIACAREQGWTFLTYTAEELAQVPGDFHESDFVRKITGVGNVCQRAAVLASQGGWLIGNKQAGQGITLAAAVRPVILKQG